MGPMPPTTHIPEVDVFDADAGISVPCLAAVRRGDQFTHAVPGRVKVLVGLGSLSLLPLAVLGPLLFFGWAAVLLIGIVAAGLLARRPVRVRLRGAILEVGRSRYDLRDVAGVHDGPDVFGVVDEDTGWNGIPAIVIELEDRAFALLTRDVDPDMASRMAERLRHGVRQAPLDAAASADALQALASVDARSRD